jgi:Methyltransferase domain
MANVRDIGKKVIRRVFDIGQRFGVNILPRHFYSPVPDIHALRKEQGWRKPFDLVGVTGANIDPQIAAFKEICPVAISKSWAGLDVHRNASEENGQGGGYGVIEADVLYGFILRHKPKRIVQVGCGVSTAIILRAAKAAGYMPNITCVEPFPSSYLLELEKENKIMLLRDPAQDVTMDIFTSLSSGDLLFIDSTHTVKVGSEVNRLILDVMPRLGKGLYVHFHDIYFPYDYPRGLLTEEIFFNLESTLLHGYLTDNHRIKIVLAMSMMHYLAPSEIAASLPHYSPQNNSDGMRTKGGEHFPSSLYLKYL